MLKPTHRLLIFFSLLLVLSSANAQNFDSDDFNEKFFISTVYSPFIDFTNSPVYIRNTPVEWDPQGVPVRFEKVPFQIIGISYISVGIEPRFNITEFNEDLALAVAAPITIGFAVVNASGNEVNGASGIGSLQIPILAKLYYGNGATYETEKSVGISIGAGFEYNKLPLLFQSSASTDDVFKQGWIMPTVSTGLHVWRGNMPMEFNLKFGLGRQIAYSRDKNGEPIIDNLTLQRVERYSRAYSFKLTFVYPMSY